MYGCKISLYTLGIFNEEFTSDPGMVVNTYNPIVWRLRQEELKFEASQAFETLSQKKKKITSEQYVVFDWKKKTKPKPEW
jgi:hypothetical protein